MRKGLLFLLVILLLSATIHKFYISTVSIRYVPQEGSFQITTQVFLDDFEVVLGQISDREIRLDPEADQTIIDSLTAAYFKEHLRFFKKGDVLEFEFLGKVYKNDLLVSYIELKHPDLPSDIRVVNTLLFDFHPDQKNIIHFRVDAKRKSFLALPSKHDFSIPNDFFHP